MEKLTVTQFLEKWDNGEFNKDVKSMIDAGWYDWFCDDKSLHSRLKNMVPKIKFIVKEKFINPDKCYVWFKNNCPVNGPLYDDFRFVNITTGENVMGVCPKSGHTQYAEFWYFSQGGKYQLMEQPAGWEAMKKNFKLGTYNEVKEITYEA